MANPEILEKTRKIIADLLKIPKEKVTDNAHLARELGMVSVQSVELIAAFEEEFDIDIEPDEVASIFTTEEAAQWIEDALKKQDD